MAKTIFQNVQKFEFYQNRKKKLIYNYILQMKMKINVTQCCREIEVLIAFG